MTSPLFAVPRRGTTAMERRVKAEVGVFADWLAANSASGIVGEVGWPGTPQWNRVGQSWLRDCRRRGLGSFYWRAGQLDDAYDLAAFVGATHGGDLSLARPQASVVRGFKSSGGVRRGVYLLDPSANTPYLSESTSSFSNANLGTYGTDYLYPSAASFTYLAGQGIDTVVLGVRWERLQPTLGAAFDATESTRLQTCISAAISAGLSVILQPFNKGAYYLDVVGTGTRYQIGSADVTQAHYNNFWTRISGLYKNEPGVVGYALMNEPDITPDEWETIAQAAVDHIRTTLTDTKLLIVPQSAQRSLPAIGSVHPLGFITDSDSNFLYEAHQYFDGPYMSGAYAQTYAQELAYAVGPKLLDGFGRADAASLGTADKGGVWYSSNMSISGGKAMPSGSAGVYAEGALDAYYPYCSASVTFSAIDGDEQYLTRAGFDRPGSRPVAWQAGAAYGSWVVRSIAHGGAATQVFSTGTPTPANGADVALSFGNGWLSFSVDGATLYEREDPDVGWGTAFGIACWQGGDSAFADFGVVPNYAGS